MTTVLLPNMPALVVDFYLGLAVVTDFFADEPADRVYTALPKTKVFPLVRVTQYNDQPVRQTPLHIVRFSLQVEAIGSFKNTAKALAETCRAYLHSDFPGVRDDAVITDVATFGMRDDPDETFTPARPRWLFAAQITAHPTPAVGS